MPFNNTYVGLGYGTAVYNHVIRTYCQNDTSASDYGKCYNIGCCRAIFVQTDTTTWPIDPTTGDSFPCAKDGTCIRYTSTAWVRTLTTIFNYPGKQAIVQNFVSRSHSPGYGFTGNVGYFEPFIPYPTNYGDRFWGFGAYNYEISSWPVYDVVYNYKAYLNPYTIPLGNVVIYRWQGMIFASNMNLIVIEKNNNNIWYAFDFYMTYAYESSPLAVIPLDHDREWLPYQELRNAFGYAATGVDQPGWNADDIIRVLKDIFPDRAWAVYDDRQFILYLYNLTIDYVPDWLIDKLAPVGIKVLQPPSNLSTAQAWLNELNTRNSQAGGQ